MQVSFPYALRGCPNIGQRAPPLNAGPVDMSILTTGLTQTATTNTILPDRDYNGWAGALTARVQFWLSVIGNAPRAPPRLSRSAAVCGPRAFPRASLVPGAAAMSVTQCG
jgi:hypothetical protein